MEKPMAEIKKDIAAADESDIRTLILTGADLSNIADMLGLTIEGHNETTRPEDQEYIAIEIAAGDTIPVHDDDGDVSHHRAIAYDPEAGREEGVIMLA